MVICVELSSMFPDGGWMDVLAVLKIDYSNQKHLFNLNTVLKPFFYSQHMVMKNIAL